MAILIQSSKNDVNISYRIVDKKLYQKILSKQKTKAKIVDDIEQYGID